MIIRTLQIDDRGLPFFFTTLQRGHRLAQSLVRRKVERLYTILPASADQQHLYEFAQGGKIASPLTRSGLGRVQRVLNTDEDLMAIIRRALDSESGLICVLEDGLSRPGHPGLEETPGIFVDGSDVYHVIEKSDGFYKEDDVARLNLAKSIGQFVGVVTTSPLEGRSHSKGLGTFTPEQIELMASKARLAFIDAYDGESYLIGEFQQ